MLVGAWNAISSPVLQAYPEMRSMLLKHPVAGFRLANFILGQVPRYLAANGLAAEPAADGFEFELNRLRIGNGHYFASSREVQQLGQDAGILP